MPPSSDVMGLCSRPSRTPQGWSYPVSLVEWKVREKTMPILLMLSPQLWAQCQARNCSVHTAQREKLIHEVEGGKGLEPQRVLNIKTQAVLHLLVLTPLQLHTQQTSLSTTAT